MMQYDLLKIKNQYGEKMAHLCRDLFPTLLETEGLLYHLIESNFGPSKFLYDDIVNYQLEIEFQDFIYHMVPSVDVENELVSKTPKQLLDEAGYILYECKTENDIQKFKKYYAKGEELCTFNGNRLDSCYVFFAVKKNVDEIHREDFQNPKRQDEYGTSVLSIQFNRDGFNALSIKNRYNHTVKNCDATFGNNLDNIIPGLGKSFEQTYGFHINFQSDFEIPGYIRANDNRFYKINYEIAGIYYGPNNVILDHLNVKEEYQQKERYLVFDYFILDMKEKTITSYYSDIKDSFLDGLTDIQKIVIEKKENRKYICLERNNQTIIIGLDRENRIISYTNNEIEEIGDDFLCHDESCQILYMEKLKKVGNAFLYSNYKLNCLYLPFLEECGNEFLEFNTSLKELSLESLRIVGNNFLGMNSCLKSLYLPKLEIVGNNFCYQNNSVTFLNLPNLKIAGNKFFEQNHIICEVSMPLLEEIGRLALAENRKLKVLILPHLKKLGFAFMYSNQVLETIELPSLESIGDCPLGHNIALNHVIVPDEIRITFLRNVGKFEQRYYSKKKGRR